MVPAVFDARKPRHQERHGTLRSRFDAIVLPIKSGARSLRNWVRTGAAEYAGGIGDEGVAALRAFVRARGNAESR